MASISPYETKSGRRYLVYYRTADRRSSTKRGFRTKRDAERWLARTEVSIEQGNFVTPSMSRTTLGDVFSEWFDNLTLTPSSVAARKSVWRNHIAPRWEATPVENISTHRLRSWVASMAGEGTGASTIQLAVIVMRQLLEHAVETRRLASNPAEGLKAPRVPHKPRHYLTHEQVQLLCEHMGDSALVVRFLAYTGLRFGELVSLRVGDVNLTTRRVTVARSTTRGIEGSTKSGKVRSVPVPRFLAEALAGLMEGRTREEHLFTSEAGTPLNNDNFRKRRFAPAVKAAGKADPSFPTGLTLHDLRHTAASLAVSAGANVKAVQSMLGHASAAMTLDVYADLFDNDLDDVASAFDRAVAGLGG